MNNIKLIRYILIGFLFFFFILLGSVRYEYIINVLEWNFPLLILRSDLNNFNNDPRWVSTFLYTIIFALSANGIVYLLFNKKVYVWITFTTYCALIFISGLLLLLYNAFGILFFNSLAHKLRDILQEPFLLLFLIAGFLLYSKGGLLIQNNSK